MNVSTIKVRDLEGRDIDLMQEYKGSALLIVIYNNACIACTGRAIPLAYDFQQKNKALKVVAVHSNMNKEIVTKEEILHIFTTKEAPFSIYIDADRKVYDQFEAEGTPQWVLITSEGRLYRSIFGSMAGAHNRLLYALEELMK